jgi:NAD(P)-dependent dehydrogenase (short-subunit alcohol dehydrogenase family)
MQKGKPKRVIHPSQKLPAPGIEGQMKQAPLFDSEVSAPGQKLKGKVALITGGDSGIGRAVAVAFARHGADIAICYLRSEQADAKETRRYIQIKYKRECLLLPGDLSRESFCRTAVRSIKRHYGKIDILVNNAGIHYPQDSIRKISHKQLLKTFSVNVFSMFYLVKAALEFMKEGSCIVNTASVTAYRGSGHLLDYSATKGAVIAFTRSLSAQLADKKIRVNAVAPGPVWTPLIVSSMKRKQIRTFGSDSPMGRAGEPFEIASSYVFLASDEASFISGQVIHPNGGEVVNG